jgi:hypothetical protein
LLFHACISFAARRTRVYRKPAIGGHISIAANRHIAHRGLTSTDMSACVEESGMVGSGMTSTGKCAHRAHFAECHPPNRRMKLTPQRQLRPRDLRTLPPRDFPCFTPRTRLT